MADSKTRKQRMRQQAGLKAALVWLSPEGQAAMATLKQPGETVDSFFNRALVTLQQVMANGTSPAPRPEADHGALATAALVRVLTTSHRKPPLRRSRKGMRPPITEVRADFAVLPS
jgi:hypothetical protein